MAMTESSRRWEGLLRRPFPCDHLLQVYTDENVLVRALAHFVGSGLRQGEAAVVIATPKHRAALMKRLAATVQAPSHSQGACIAVDAKRCLTKFMVDGRPDRAAFRSTITGLLDRLRRGGYERIRLFGEMVDILWHENQQDAAVRLEELWTEVLAEYQVSLLCAYHADAAESRRVVLHRISRSHSHAFAEDEDQVA